MIPVSHCFIKPLKSTDKQAKVQVASIWSDG